MEKYGYRFSFGPWNVHEGADPFGPPVRPTRDFDSKLTIYKEPGLVAEFVAPRLWDTRLRRTRLAILNSLMSR